MHACIDMNKRDFYLGTLLGAVMSVYGNLCVNYFFDFARGTVREDIWYGLAVPSGLVLGTIGLLLVGWMVWREAKKSGNE